MGTLEPEINQRAVSDETRSLRADYDQLSRFWSDVLQPRINGHLLVFQDVIDRLVHAHREVVEQSDIEIDADTRWSAIWEISGRCLALASLFIAELRLGYTAETAGTIRVIDEAVHLLHAVADGEGDVWGA